ncbi:aspartate aminotransferase family protein [Fibrella forsythiae]|uniref:Aspartate aminotransferase family protein n=1 Tax=Fibrella forsythiae TaxID=2817061 RepID=A0ABS3JE25_9BACT|nr:aminotransferase class III-fold pyridoxal phosphate-dependent enzyme [Fibrella forsythiae]MBO0947117.1 aspartate aminotransferase family protein [Fibrella forsythiae]
MTHRQLFFQHIAQTTDFPLALEIVRAEGVYLFGLNGETYLDLISGIGVSNVGHRHPAVLVAVQAQLDKYMHLMVYGEYVQGPQAELAHALVATLEGAKTTYGPINNVYFTNSGTEAVEGAMKVAKRFTGRTELIACHNAYHGSTQGALSLSGDENFKRNYRPLLPDIRHIHHGDWDDLAMITTRTAAVIMEVIQGEAGVRVPDAAYLHAVRERCTATGTLLIFDEIQTGFGRTGSFWAFQGIDPDGAAIVPDILLSAKGMGGGMPIGAFMAPEPLMAVIKNNPMLGHITTFGGHPVSCAASLATLQTIQNERLFADAERKGQLIRSLLVHPLIREIRGKGLMLAAEFDSFEVLKPIIDRSILPHSNVPGLSIGWSDQSGESTPGESTLGIITDWFLFCNNSMRIAPPLTITDDEIRLACQVILSSIDSLDTRLAAA